MRKFRNLVKNHTSVFVFAALAAGILCVVITGYVIFSNIGAIGGFLSAVARVLSPVIIGLVTAYIIDPLVEFFEEKVLRRMKNAKTRRTVSTVIALVLVLALLGLFVGTLIPSLISSILMLIDNAEGYYKTIEDVAEKINGIGFGLNINLEAIENSVNNFLGNIVNNLSENFSSVLDTTKNIGASLVNALMGVILAVYFLFSKRYLLAGVERLRRAVWTPKQYDEKTRFWNRCNDIFTQYIGCNLIDALIIGMATAVFMLALGMPYAPLVAFVVGVANLIPTFGPIIGAVVGALLLVLVKPAYALWFLVFTVAIQILDAYVIKPRLFSSSFGISAVLTLVSITVGSNLFGIVGVLLAIPVAAILSFVYDERLIPWLEKKTSDRAVKTPAPASPEPAGEAETKE
ncbi:MAG: AI-2E family transporter [Oscillospiraceae bacterium]|nr:AI-2E family transporter [Oscillospiraceae bacterium]